MKRLPEKPVFLDRMGMHCHKREGEHKCVRPEGHSGPGYTLTMVATLEGAVTTWWEMEVHE